MSKLANRQPVLKPQDLLVLLALLSHGDGPVVFVGGCAAGLLLTDPAATQARLTNDVDLIAEVTALRGYHVMEAKFARRGFTRDLSPEAPICRWRCRDIEVDLMPTDGRILGFANRWYPQAVAAARQLSLPSGTAATSRLQTIAAFAHP